jgi:hypothetical protein
MIKANTGSFAPHIINGTTNIVISLSLLESRVLAAKIPGTAHPFVESINGKKDLPLRLNLFIILSITNAALAIYPESSKKAIAKNINNTSGKNFNTDPTPLIIPSTIKDFNCPDGSMLDVKFAIHLKKISKILTKGPEKINVNLKIMYITKAKIGIARYLFNTKVSIISVISILFLTLFLRTALTIELAKP